MNIKIINLITQTKSLFTKSAVSRKYDCWYYLKGKLISKYELIIKNLHKLKLIKGEKF